MYSKSEEISNYWYLLFQPYILYNIRLHGSDIFERERKGMYLKNHAEYIPRGNSKVLFVDTTYSLPDVHPINVTRKKVVPRNVLDTNTVHSSHKVHMCSNLNFQDELVPMNSSWDNETFAPLAISHHCIWLWLVASGKSRIRSNAKLSINTATQYNKSWSRNDIESLSASLTPFPLCVISINVVRGALLHHSRGI